jgi:hypothetical protein
MTIEQIKEVEAELKRFNSRLKAVKERAKIDTYTFFGCKETGALKRAAADLKMELTKIT